MAAIDNAAIPTEENYVPFDDFLLRLSAQEVVNRLLRFLNARNNKKDGLLLRIVIQLLDEKCSAIKPFIPAPIYQADEQTHDAAFLCTTKVLCVLQKGFVVPRNLHIQTKYKAHINIEWCNKSSAIKYLFKYISKGMDGATFVIQKGNGVNGRGSGNGVDDKPRNE